MVPSSPRSSLRPRHRTWRAFFALPLVLAAVVVLARFGTGCGLDDQATFPAETTPTGTAIQPSDDLTPSTKTIYSPDGLWTVSARFGPGESFDLTGPDYAASVHDAFALEFSPDSKLFIYRKHSAEYGRSFLFLFNTRTREHKQITNTDLPPPPLSAEASANMIYGPEQPIEWNGHVISWTVPGESRYKLDLESGKVLSRTRLNTSSQEQP